MGGFIVLEDGRAYAASNWATDAVIRAIAAKLADSDLRNWLLDQQSTIVGLGMTCVDLRELGPRFRSAIYAAARQALASAAADGFENLDDASETGRSWLTRFGDLIEMIERWQAGQDPADFNPHMRGVVEPTGRREGPGWI